MLLLSQTDGYLLIRIGYISVYRLVSPWTMVIIVVIYIIASSFCEARVFCEDSNASPWTPLGYTCPVLCATVVNAIKRLQIMDYKKTLFQDLTLEPLSDINEVVFSIERSKQTEKEKMHKLNFDKHNYKNSKKIIKQKRGIYYNKIDNNINHIFNKDMKTNINLNADKIANNRALLDPKYGYFKIEEITKFVNKMASLLKTEDNNATALRIGFNNSSASRKFHIDNTFVSIMTNILNKYVSSSFKFTQEMTEVILQKLFTSDTQMRLYDVGQLLKYLRQAVHINNNINNYIITLRPRHCMSISIPGCFCKTGFVENSGQCVQPAKCLSDNSLLKYLDRIIILQQ